VTGLIICPTCLLVYKAFSIFLDDAYLDYSNLLLKNNAKFSDVAKMLNVIPIECENNFRKF
jgi:hypothetical protein